jgi:glycosyltransferase involved in cell wall biosynthesis
MKVAIDISPLQTGHSVRGAGFYLENLKRALVKYYPQNEYKFFARGEKLPENVGLVHFPYFEPFFLALPIYKKYLTVVTVHDLTPIVFKKNFPRGLKGEIKWQMQRYALRKANAIITDSNCSKKDIVKHVGVSAERVTVIYLAAGEEFKVIENLNSKMQGLRERYGLPEKFVLYVGDVTWNKNLPRLIEAVKGINVPLVMVGKALVSEDFDRKNPWNKDLVKVQSLSRDDKNIIKLGFVSTEDLVGIYNLATLFVMPSLYEGFGLPILEAMSCGCPVITTKEGSLEEVAGDTALYVDGYSKESMAKGIKEVFENPILQKKLMQGGLKRINEFSWKKTAGETLGVYRKVLDNY